MIDTKPTYYVYDESGLIPTLKDVSIARGGSAESPEEQVADLARQYPDCIYFEVAPEVDESVILVAFSVEHPKGSSPQAALLPRLQPVLESRDSTSPVTSWWVAEDVREDGSDLDSAVFVNPGSAHLAGILLSEHGLTEDYNIPADARNGQFEKPEPVECEGEQMFTALFRAVSSLDDDNDGSALSEVLDAFQGRFESVIDR